MPSRPRFPGDRSFQHFTVFAAVWLAAMALAAPLAALDCSQPPGAVRVDSNYVSSSTGDWWKITQYVDDGPWDNLINTGDSFNFTDGSGQPIQLADPTIFRLESQYGLWYYISGTSDAYATGNFPVYRTRDFSTFELHMLAFDEANRGGSNQWRVGGTLYLNGTWYTNLWSPHLYVDPTLAEDPQPQVLLSFSAVQQGTDPFNDQSVYLVRILQSDFLNWHTLDPIWSDGPRFADVRKGLGFQHWYYYNTTNFTGGPPYLYDGGFSVGHLVPASGSTALLGPNCGQLERRSRGLAHRCQGAASWMIDGPFVFFDPNLSAADPWKRVLLYNWADANSDVTFDYWGNHVAAHPLLSNNMQFDVNFATIPIAMDRNDNLRVNGLDNGVVDLNQQTWFWGGVAEGATAFYHPETNRYYTIYGRNTWDSAAYQIVYRMTEPGQPFSSIQLPWFMDQTVPEHLLVRSIHFTDGGRANFGGPEIFTLTDGNGETHYYLLLHVKFDYDVNQSAFTGRRTVYFKELTVENPSTGVLKRLYEHNSDPARNIRIFRIPRCRQ